MNLIFTIISMASLILIIFAFEIDRFWIRNLSSGIDYGWTVIEVCIAGSLAANQNLPANVRNKYVRRLEEHSYNKRHYNIYMRAIKLASKIDRGLDLSLAQNGGDDKPISISPETRQFANAILYNNITVEYFIISHLNCHSLAPRSIHDARQLKKQLRRDIKVLHKQNVKNPIIKHFKRDVRSALVDTIGRWAAFGAIFGLLVGYVSSLIQVSTPLQWNNWSPLLYSSVFASIFSVCGFFRITDINPSTVSDAYHGNAFDKRVSSWIARYPRGAFIVTCATLSIIYGLIMSPWFQNSR